MPTTMNEHRMTVAEASVRLWEGGSGTPLIFLHGAGGVHSLFPSLDFLTVRHRVFVPEHPGFGVSDCPAWMNGVDDLVFHYRELFERLELGSFHLAGLSLGGWIAAELAVNDSSRLRSLTLVDAAGLWIEEAPMADVSGVEPQQLARLVWYDLSKAAAQAPPSDPETNRIQARNRKATARFAGAQFCNPKLRRRLKWVRTPTLVVWGAQDGLIPVAHGQAWAESIPGARLETIDQCGHIPPAEQPRDFAQRLLDFIRDVEAG